jgi:hypothetical protein
MSVQPLGDFLSGSYQKSYLQKIFIGQKLEKVFSELAKGPVKVVIKDKTISVGCTTPAQATFLRLKRTRLYAVVNETLNTKSHGYTVRVRVRYS